MGVVPPRRKSGFVASHTPPAGHGCGTVPSSRVPQLVAALPDLTGGEAVLTTGFDHYAPVTGEEPPVLRRRGPDPADREVWFRAVPR